METDDSNQAQPDPVTELPGDTNSADIVGRTGEEMPLQSHDGLENGEGQRSSPDDHDDPEPVRADDDNPRGQVAA